ncbi:FUSC family protein [Methylobacterium planeticum]|uniref:FUSC family protein n=1 Tax=Methylobacterium planeticum TaxID=2615211 RepID=A0A6N6MMH5_9HYPH|nr:FUSC family protein [Methylobacterium planeticum]KAB1071969.1 FUSC family protein [Methylobacterium planeticum]
MSPAASPPVAAARIDRWLDRIEAVVPKPAAWAFAIRIWLAMMLALYAAFWLQLESASSAAVCVAILAQPKRGQALSKAFYRFVGTLLGGAVAIVMIAAFGQDRVLLLVTFTTWLSLCVFVANFLQDTRAYGAMLSGYTVAIIAIANIDTPQAVFDSAVSRVAAIALGIVAITFINDALASPSTWRALRVTLADGLASTKAFARDCILAGDPGPEGALAQIRRIVPMRADASAIAGELDDGPQRAAGARSGVAALYALVAAGRTFALAVERMDRPSPAVTEARAICERLTADGADSPAAQALAAARDRLRALLLAAVRRGEPDPAEVVALQRALDLATALGFAQDGITALSGGHRPLRDVALPTHRDFPVALRAALRIALAFGLTCGFFIATGWPATSFALVQVAATGALSSLAPDPRKFANGVLIGMSLATLSAGFVLFVVLSGGQGFPLLAIAMAPVIFLACFLSLNPPTFGPGFILLVFFPVLVSPSNPQIYNLQTFLQNGILVLVAAVILWLTVRLVLPVSPAQARAFAFQSAHRDVRDALVGEGGDATTRTSLNSDRVAQYAQWNTGTEPVRRRRLELAFALAHLEAAAARAHAQLRALWSSPELRAPTLRARRALAEGPPASIPEATRALLAAARGTDADTALCIARAASDLIAAWRVMDRHGRFLQRLRIPSL